MADLEVLHGEPRHKVTAFANEMLGRSRSVLRDMGQELERMLRALISQFDAFRQAHYLITFQDVRFTETKWLQDGRLLLTFGMGRKPHDPEALKHIVVDAFVKDVAARSVPQEFRDECEGFLRALVFQFSILEKDLTLDLRRIRFETPTWINDRQLVIGITHNGVPLRPRDVRVD